MTTQLCLFLLCAFGGVCVFGVKSFSLTPRVVALSLVALFVANSDSAPNEPKHYFLGFDRNDYPGDEAMKLLRRDFAFTGYWLSNPPGEKNNLWIGKREFLRSQGFGFVALYRGPDSRELSTQAVAKIKGARDGADAVAHAKTEGFSRGAIIFLDIEEGGRLPDTYHSYLAAWADELARGGNRPGVYCSGIPVKEEPGMGITSADDIRTHALRDFTFWVYNDACPPSPGCSTPQDLPGPSKSGIAYAQIWQFVRSPRDKQTARHCRGYAKDGNCYAALDIAHRFHLDVNSATTADPSGAAK
jgi:glycoside hydrolase-like protein